MRILIVGAGIGGLSLAAFLKDTNVEYDIVEKCPDWSHQGFLIAMWDSGRDILKKLGLAEEFDKRGTRIQKYSLRDGTGKLLREYDFSEFYAEYGSAMTAILRSDLHAWLLSRVDTSRIKMDTSITELQEETDSIRVVFTNGEVQRYDVVVGADGVHSKVRSLTFSGQIESYENWRIWYLWIDHKYDIPGTATEYAEPGELIFVFSGAGKTAAWLFAPADHAQWDNEHGRAARLKRIFKEESKLMPRMLEHINDADIVPSDLVSLSLKTWHTGRIALLGDAAHNFGPHAGIGGGMALEDGYVLAGELLQVSATYPLESALATYEHKRRTRIKLAEYLSKRIRQGTLIQSPFMRHTFNLMLRFVPVGFFKRSLMQLLGQEI
ncbi:MAG TPA: FAD-dependent monooxygenase [Candidatus Paceibacterota bacterium]